MAFPVDQSGKRRSERSHNISTARSSSSGDCVYTTEMERIVIIFDFDRTLIDGDSDRWVVTEMGLTEIFHQLRFTLPWNRLMVFHILLKHPNSQPLLMIYALLKKY